jgi:ApaG protein
VGEDTEVEGAGVVGEQPTVCPGQVHEYRSFCVLKSTDGYMEGHYRFVRVDGSSFDAEIPRFVLHADVVA